MKPLNSASAAAIVLRLRLALGRLGPFAIGAVLLFALGFAALLWLAPQRALQDRQQAVALGLAAMPPPAVKSAPVTANENMVLFYATLGEKRYAEQQVKTLFGLAAKAGLTLSQGEYKSSYDKHGRLHTYQVSLPVKGSYRAIWQFGLQALDAIPFASLDEINFKRDTITDPNVEARLRLTLYLADRPVGGMQ